MLGQRNGVQNCKEGGFSGKRFQRRYAIKLKVTERLGQNKEGHVGGGGGGGNVQTSQ